MRESAWTRTAIEKVYIAKLAVVISPPKMWMMHGLVSSLEALEKRVAAAFAA